jgi:hypothetical protein
VRAVFTNGVAGTWVPGFVVTIILSFEDGGVSVRLAVSPDQIDSTLAILYHGQSPPRGEGHWLGLEAVI